MNEYQKQAHEFAAYNNPGGELEEIKKFIQNSIDTTEYGDVAQDGEALLKSLPKHSTMFYTYPVLGLAGEAGEVTEVIKKTLRDGYPPEKTRELLRAEMGDVMWYLAELATVWDLSLEEIAQANIVKLGQRKQRGTIKGSGNDR